MEPTEIQVSYDVVNVYQSVPLDRSVRVIVEFLPRWPCRIKKENKIKSRGYSTTPRIMFSECHFLYSNVIWTRENSGPIRLSIMVVLSECYLQRIEYISITQVLNLNLAPRSFKRFADDSHARFNNKELQLSLQLLDILNSQDPSIQYTIEFENENKQLSFLDITITNNSNNSYDFKISRKHQ